MAYVKWTVTILFWLLLAGFLHYTLPQWDVVMVSQADSKREGPAEAPLFWTSARPANEVRDVFFLRGQTPDGGVRNYRNEDTGYGWPPFFKFNSSDVQARAAGYQSTMDNPTWVAVKHYGWRTQMFTTYPNVLRLKPVESPDTRIIPWTSIVMLILLTAVGVAFWVRWRRFREARLDPIFEAMDDRFDDMVYWLRQKFGRRS